MTAPAPLRLAQAARMLGLQPEDLDSETARSAIALRPGDFAHALLQEAADSDDVTSAESAIDYCDGRLTFFGDLITPEAAGEVRAAFASLVQGW
jgi:hypothetical protein